MTTRETVAYRRVRVVTERVYDVEGHAPDTTDRTGKRRFTVRPRQLTLRTYGTGFDTTVDTVAVEGRLVRTTDGGLGPSRIVLHGTHDGDRWPGHVPDWIDAIMRAEGLQYRRPS